MKSINNFNQAFEKVKHSNIQWINVFTTTWTTFGTIFY